MEGDKRKGGERLGEMKCVMGRQEGEGLKGDGWEREVVSGAATALKTWRFLNNFSTPDGSYIHT